MTGMLASVNSLDEAQLVLEAGADIIDLKQPAQGALGALDIQTVNDIVAAIDGQRPVSATIGDLPMQPGQVLKAGRTMAATGVDYVKIGFFPGGDWLNTITQLAQLTRADLRLIAVLFADRNPNFNTIAQLADFGFTGVMLDTMDKRNGSLTSVMPLQKIQDFVERSRRYGLICGLAGSLRCEDIVTLLPYNPDYLGFRGALCSAGIRTSSLNPKAVSSIKQTLSSSTPVNRINQHAKEVIDHL